MKKPVRIIFPAVLFGLLLTALYFYNNRDKSLARVQYSKRIHIGYPVGAPYAFLKSDKEVAGQSTDLAKYVARRLGAEKIEWRQVEFSELFTELRAGRIDVVAGGPFITPENAAFVNFSEPVFHVKQGLLVPRGNPRRLTSYKNLITTPGLRIAVIADSIELGFLTRAGVPEEQIVAVPDALTGRVAVEAGNADCFAVSSPAVHWMALSGQLGKTEEAQLSEQFQLSPDERQGYGGFAFRKEDVALRDAWNEVLKEFVGSPEYNKMAAEYGFTDAELPGSMTTVEVLKR
ncbi:MAG: transporter substrate-binding domain-containing protein [Acidobacteria bacterium]|nr:transporter substrate-binding domain-containing protein [Acidobacteriota bacterium]